VSIQCIIFLKGRVDQQTPEALRARGGEWGRTVTQSGFNNQGGRSTIVDRSPSYMAEEKGKSDDGNVEFHFLPYKISAHVVSMAVHDECVRTMLGSFRARIQ
jgi:hypothetical protein